MVENVIRIKSGTTMNIGVSSKIQKIIMCAKDIIFGICSCGNDKYVGSIIDDLLITCEKIIDTRENFKEER